MTWRSSLSTTTRWPTAADRIIHLHDQVAAFCAAEQTAAAPAAGAGNVALQPHHCRLSFCSHDQSARSISGSSPRSLSSSVRSIIPSGQVNNPAAAGERRGSAHEAGWEAKELLNKGVGSGAGRLVFTGRTERCAVAKQALCKRLFRLQDFI